LFLTKPAVIFVFISLTLLGFYMYYASKNVGKLSNKYFNLILFFLFFAILFGFWWMVSFFYALFFKKIKWK